MTENMAGSILAGKTNIAGANPLPVQSYQNWLKNRTPWYEDKRPKSDLDPKLFKAIDDFASGRVALYTPPKAETAPKAEAKPADTGALEKELRDMRSRRDTLAQQVKEAERMASYGNTGGSELYRSVQDTLQAALDAEKAKIKDKETALADVQAQMQAGPQAQAWKT